MTTWTMPEKDSRKDEPRQTIDAGENPTVCIHCDTRTVLDEYWAMFGKDATGRYYAIREVCPHCGQHYRVDQNEDED